MNDIINKKINIVLLVAYVIVCILFPGDVYNLKKILFMLIIAINTKLIVKSIVTKKWLFITSYSFIFFLVLSIHSYVLNKDIQTAILRSYSSIMLVLVIIIFNYRINFDKIFLKSIYIVVLITLGITIFDILGAFNLNSNTIIRKMMYDYGIGIMGKHESYSFYYKVFMRSSPLMAAILFESINNKKYFQLGMIVLAILFTGTRANVGVMFGMLLIYIVINNKNKIQSYIFEVYEKYKKTINKSKRRILSLLIAIISVFALINILKWGIETFILSSKISNNIRVGHLRSIIELIVTKPSVIIIGMGMGSSFYSHGVGEFINSIEWSYLDLWRQMGLPMFIIFLVFLMRPLTTKNKIPMHTKFGFVSYLIIAGTNPLLYSSTAYLYYIYMYYLIYKKEENQFEKSEHIIGSVQT